MIDDVSLDSTVQINVFSAKRCFSCFLLPPHSARLSSLRLRSSSPPFHLHLCGIYTSLPAPASPSRLHLLCLRVFTFAPITPLNSHAQITNESHRTKNPPLFREIACKPQNKRLYLPNCKREALKTQSPRIATL